MRCWLVALVLLGSCSLLLDEGSSGPSDTIDASIGLDAAVTDWTPWQFSPRPALSGNVMLETPIDTGGNLCLENREPCVIAAENMTVLGIVEVDGPRPLILVARFLTINGVIDVSASSSKSPPGRRDCAYVTMQGAGGRGGDGETSGGLGGGGTGNEEPAEPSELKAGCTGGAPVGTGGIGGGAIQLIGYDSLTLAGTILAHGAGGRSPAMATNGIGGAGGGAGGMVVLDSPTIELVDGALILARGGGGSSASSQAEAGNNGNDGSDGLASGGPSVQGGGGGSGGTGGDRDVEPLAGGEGATGLAGGGGGGSVGLILVNTDSTTLDDLLRTEVAAGWTSAPRSVSVP